MDSISRSDFIRAAIDLLEVKVEEEKRAPVPPDGADTWDDAENAFDALSFDFPCLSEFQILNLNRTLQMHLQHVDEEGPTFWKSHGIVFRVEFVRGVCFIVRGGEDVREKRILASLSFVHIPLQATIMNLDYSSVFEVLVSEILPSVASLWSSLTEREWTDLRMTDTIIGLLNKLGGVDVEGSKAEIQTTRVRNMYADILCARVIDNPSAHSSTIDRLLRCFEGEPFDRLGILVRLARSVSYDRSASMRKSVEGQLSSFIADILASTSTDKCPSSLSLSIDLCDACAKTASGVNRLFRSGSFRSLVRLSKTIASVASSARSALLSCAVRSSRCREFLVKAPGFVDSVRTSKRATLWLLVLSFDDDRLVKDAREHVSREILLLPAGKGDDINIAKLATRCMSISRFLRSLLDNLPGDLLPKWGSYRWLCDRLNSLEKVLRQDRFQDNNEDGDESKTPSDGDEHEKDLTRKTQVSVKRLRLLILKIRHLDQKSS